jgi:hypothetical protein
MGNLCWRPGIQRLGVTPGIYCYVVVLRAPKIGLDTMHLEERSDLLGRK